MPKGTENKEDLMQQELKGFYTALCPSCRFGARGYSRNLPLERMARDVRMFTIGGGTAEVLRNVVAGAILKKKLPQTRDGWLKTAE